MDADRKKYNKMEAVLQQINKTSISLSDAEKLRNNQILNSIIDQIIKKMKEVDSLFNEMYTILFYGGSYYDGLKVNKPDEYDLDMLLKMPDPLKYKLKAASNVPGFVLLEFVDFAPSMKQLDLTGKHKGMDLLMNPNHYLDTTKVLQWMQKVVQKALNTFDKSGNNYIMKTPHGQFLVKYSKSGPAYTLKANGRAGSAEVYLDVDLVTCFVFPGTLWPKDNFRKNPVSQKPNFFIVPKQLKGGADTSHYWRLSFQEQERVIMDKKEKLKPTIKLLKKMRDILQHKTIASYYLKTVALWVIDEKENEPGFWNNSLSFVFMTVLKRYQQFLEKGVLPYYWNRTYNLMNAINAVTLTNINNKIKAVINDIDNHLDDPMVIAKYLVSPQELLKLKQQSGR